LNSNYYVYALLDSSKPGTYKYDDLSFDYEPFYIGKGTGNRIKDTLYDKTSFKKNKIDKLNSLGVEIISIKIKEGISNEKAILLEKKYINLIGRRDQLNGSLVNLTGGGDGRLSSPHTQEVKDKISKTYLSKNLKWNHKKETLKKMSQKQKGQGNGFYGKKHSEEVKERHSELMSGVSHPMYGKKHTEEAKTRLKEHRKNNISNDLIKQSCQKFNKEVDMYNLNMEYLKSFKSVKEASENTGINESLISKCCRGDIKSPTRYYFKYKNKTDNIKSNKFLINKGDLFFYKKDRYVLLKRNKKTCVCLNDDGKEVTIHTNDFKYLFEKEKNDSDIVELFLFVKSLYSETVLKDDMIYNEKIKIRFLKTIKESEIFNNTTKIKKDNHDIIIFDDEWDSNKDIIKSRIKNALGFSRKIGARKCIIKEISDNKLIKKFLKENHLQGFVGSKVKIGLFYKDELVSLITFGSLRKNLGQKSKQGHYELLRFCNKKGLSIVGGASRLFKYFINKYNPDYILSYADYRWSEGNLYKNLGFELVDKTIPNYFYIIDYKRKNRFNFRKDLLVSKGHDINKTEIQIMHEQSFYRIWDLGSLKFVYRK
jgi:group I intron endonuclease